MDFVFRRIVLGKTFKGQPLPIEVFSVATDQLRHVLVKPESVRQRQGLDCLFDFMQRFHGENCRPFARFASGCFLENG